MKGKRMSKGPGIMDMPETRVAPRRPVNGEPRTGQSERAAFGARAPGRVPVATYLEPEQLAIVQALLARLRGEERRRVTMQEALAKALQKWCAEHEVKLPSEI
jgi:hypothetical protein